MSAIILSPSYAFAGEDNEASVLWGAKATFDVNIPGKWRNALWSDTIFRPGYGFTVGGVCNIDLAKGFYLEPGISFFYDTYVADLTIADENGSIAYEDPRVSKAGLRVPVMVGYWFNISDRFDFTVFTGPELSYALSGKIKFKDAPAEVEWNDNLYGAEGMQRRCDMAWKVGIGVPLESFLISVDAAIGLTDLIPGPASCRDNRVSVSATYYF